MNSRLRIKNPTPRELARYAAGIVAVSLLVAMGILKLIFPNSLPWWFILIIPVVGYVIGLITFTEVLETYIYRKIKLIYKTIRRSKMDPGEKASKVDLDSNIIDDVEKEVETWAASRSNEFDELKKLAEYRRDFMGDISHELKTPIFNIQGYLHTLLDGGLEDGRINYAYLKKAAKNVERLHNIVQDLESITRMENDVADLDIDDFSIMNLVNQIFEENSIKADEKGIKLRYKQGAEKDFRVLADREKIAQVLVNLISNSIKYGKPGGLTQIGIYDMDKVILIEVADNGIGIDEEHLSRVFDRFYRVDKSRSRDQGGTGLGLSIVKHIVEAHQQTINVRSTKDRGSTFGFTLEKAG